MKEKIKQETGKVKKKIRKEMAKNNQQGSSHNWPIQKNNQLKKTRVRSRAHPVAWAGGRQAQPGKVAILRNRNGLSGHSCGRNSKQQRMKKTKKHLLWKTMHSCRKWITGQQFTRKCRNVLIAFLDEIEVDVVCTQLGVLSLERPKLKIQNDLNLLSNPLILALLVHSSPFYSEFYTELASAQSQKSPSIHLNLLKYRTNDAAHDLLMSLEVNAPLKYIHTHRYFCSFLDFGFQLAELYDKVTMNNSRKSDTVRIMHDYGMRALFKMGFDFDALHLLFYQLQRLVKDYAHELYAQFNENGVETHMYASQWFLTLSIAKFPLQMVFFIVGLFLAEGMNTIFHISLALLQDSKKELLPSDFEGILKFFRVKLPRTYRTKGSAKEKELPQSLPSFLFRLRKQSYERNPTEESYQVVYLGNMLTAGLGKGEASVDKPLSVIWRTWNAKRGQRQQIGMKLAVTRSGLKAESKQLGLTEYWAHRITY